MSIILYVSIAICISIIVLCFIIWCFIKKGYTDDYLDLYVHHINDRTFNDSNIQSLDKEILTDWKKFLSVKDNLKIFQDVKLFAMIMTTLGYFYIVIFFFLLLYPEIISILLNDSKNVYSIFYIKLYNLSNIFLAYYILNFEKLTFIHYYKIDLNKIQQEHRESRQPHYMSNFYHHVTFKECDNLYTVKNLIEYAKTFIISLFLTYFTHVLVLINILIEEFNQNDANIILSNNILRMSTIICLLIIFIVITIIIIVFMYRINYKSDRVSKQSRIN